MKRFYHIEKDTKGLSSEDRFNFNNYEERLESFVTLIEAYNYVQSLQKDTNVKGYGIFTSVYKYENNIPDEDLSSLKFMTYMEAV